jgi:hypothetical protein
VIALDPWFFPHRDDYDLATLDHQKSMIIMTEFFPKEIKEQKAMAGFDNVAR